MRKNLIVFILLIFVFASCSSNKKVKAPYTIVSYNAENLFDTIDDPNKFDEEFTPEATKNWNTERYNKKLSDLARVISVIDSVKLPVLVGLVEIENDVVLNDLIAQPKLKNAGYKIVWEDGPDFRSIDCALLYNPSVFVFEAYESIPVLSENEPDFTTRDILYVKGAINGEIFHVFVNHWPSRRGGAEISEPKRVLAANVLRKKVEEIQSADPMANIIIMGDMNDEPGDISLSDVLMANSNASAVSDQQLVNLMYDEYENQEGSYSYQGDWDMIDNMIVSGALINKTKGLKTTLTDGKIFHQPFMEFVSNNGDMSPNRTYGRQYYGGTSDHFPIYMVLK